MEVLVENLNFGVVEVGRVEEVPAPADPHCQSLIDGVSGNFICHRCRHAPVPCAESSILAGKDESCRAGGTYAKIRSRIGDYSSGRGKTGLAVGGKWDLHYKVKLPGWLADRGKSRVVVADPKWTAGKERHPPWVFEVRVPMGSL